MGHWARRPRPKIQPGYWATEKNESQIHITHCGDKLCGNIFWMKEPTDAKGALKLDKENEDEVKRKRSLSSASSSSA